MAIGKTLYYQDVFKKIKRNVCQRINARWYDSEIGRFISVDPAKDGVNWYTYGANNPLRFVDPTGYFTEEKTTSVNYGYAESERVGTIGKIEDGDSLERLAKERYGDEKLASVLAEANGLDPEDPRLKEGQVLYIPDITPLKDKEDNLRGYIYSDLMISNLSSEDNQKYLASKHHEAEGFSIISFGETQGNAGNDVIGNLVVAGVALCGQQVMAAGSATVDALALWGIGANGANQGIKHFFNYDWKRVSSIANQLGANINKTLRGFREFTQSAIHVVNNWDKIGGKMRVLGDKAIYYYNKVIIIMYDNKIQSVMKGTEKSFNKMK